MVAIVLAPQGRHRLLTALPQPAGQQVDVIGHLREQLLLRDAADAYIGSVHTDVGDVVQLREDAELRELRDARQEISETRNIQIIKPGK